jgi:arginase
VQAWGVRLKEMNPNIYLLGLGLERGQEKQGLVHSANHFRAFYLRPLQEIGIQLLDFGQISEREQGSVKIHTFSELVDFEWNPYQTALHRIRDLMRLSGRVLNWGGDHSVAIATVGAFVQEEPEGFVLWIDAHADLNLPEYSPTGNLHGMPMSVLLNLQQVAEKQFPWLARSLSPSRLIYLGVRDLDPFEKATIHHLGIRAYSASDVRKRGMQTIVSEIQSLIGSNALHISFDIDSLSPEFAPSTGVPVKAGLCLDDIKIVAHQLSQHRFLRSLDVVEINPRIGTTSEVRQTYLAALQFLWPFFTQGGKHAGIGRPNQKLGSASLEWRT